MSDRTEAMENLIEPCPNDLVQRLRADVFYGDARLANMDKHNPLHMDAADCIEAQAAVIERLRVEAKAQFDRGYYDGCTRAALEARGLEIREKNDE